MFCFVLVSFNSTCIADNSNGIAVEERVVNLPQDQNKWYISIVGGGLCNEGRCDLRFNMIMNWFNTNPNLKSLKNQVHFCIITVGTPIYKERYEKNISGIPTVRVQKADGTVVYEAAGKYIPLSAEGLYGAIVDASQKAQGIFPLLPWRRKCGPLLPWRRDMDRRLDANPSPGPCPEPEPDVQPYPPDPDPQPLDDGGAPELPESSHPRLRVILGVLSALLGGGIGIAVQWKRTYQR